eukprot:6375780-Prymnesium_polylepis.1
MATTTTTTTSPQQNFDAHRLRGAAELHRITATILSAWATLYFFMYNGELRLVGTLWPSVFKIKLT